MHREGLGHVTGDHRVQRRKDHYCEGDAEGHQQNVLRAHQQEHRVRRDHAQQRNELEKTTFADALGEQCAERLREQLNDGHQEQAIENRRACDALILGDVGDHEGVGEEEPGRADGHCGGSEQDLPPARANHVFHRVFGGLVVVPRLGEFRRLMNAGADHQADHHQHTTGEERQTPAPGEEVFGFE
ncbi:hypothetical protein D3C84_714790 [compost metagenome]